MWRPGPGERGSSTCKPGGAPHRRGFRRGAVRASPIGEAQRNEVWMCRGYTPPQGIHIGMLVGHAEVQVDHVMVSCIKGQGTFPYRSDPRGRRGVLEEVHRSAHKRRSQGLPEGAGEGIRPKGRSGAGSMSLANKGHRPKGSVVHKTKKVVWLIKYDDPPVWHLAVILGLDNLFPPLEGGRAGVYIVFKSAWTII